MGRRQFNPTTKRFDERVVVRKQEAFNWGMITDMAPVDIPYNAVTKLVNARGHKNAVRGRTGSRKWSEATIPLAKTVTCHLTGSTLNNSGHFSQDDIGRTVRVTISGKEWVMFVSDYIDDQSVTVAKSKDMPDFASLTCSFYDNINAQYFDPLTRTRFFLIGSTVYARRGRSDTWEEYYIIGAKPISAPSQIYRMGEVIVLVNQNGIYAINDIDKNHYAWKMNDTLPRYKLYSDAVDIDSTIPSSYRYIYTYSRQTGMYSENRLNGVNIIEVETPPVDASNRIKAIRGRSLKDYNTDYDEITINAPVSGSTGKRHSLNIHYRNADAWVRLTENNMVPTLSVSVGGNSLKCYPKFTTCESMKDVASAFERALYDISAGFRVLYYSGTNSWLMFYHTDKNLDFDLVANPEVGETDLYSASYIYPIGTEHLLGVKLKKFLYPTTRSDITHYSLYRTKDIYPYTVDTIDLTDPRTSNSPETYGWVADIPVVDTIAGTITLDTGNYYMTLTSGWEYCIGGDYRPISQYDSRFIVNSYDPKTARYSITFYGPNPQVGAFTAFSGATDSLNVSQAGDTVRVLISSNTTKGAFAESDVGKTIFFQDGTSAVISEFVNSTEVKVVNPNDKDWGIAYMNPTERTWYDTVPDMTRDGYLSYWPLRTRFFRQLPSSEISAYHNGVLMVAERDKNDLYYSDTEYLQHIGYNSPEQYNDGIKAGIRCLFVVNDRFAVLTTTSTHTINTRQSTTVTTDYGEAYSVVPDPVLVTDSIGTVNQFRTARGERGDIMVLTQEPAVRFFNGSEYSANYADGRIQETHLQLLNENTISSYSASGGIHLWGYRSDIYDN